MGNELPRLIFDDQCACCSYWVRYWERLAGPRVRFSPYQAVVGHYPAMPTEGLAPAIQWMDGDSTRDAGAHAAFRVLAQVPAHRYWPWAYRQIPAFARFAEWAYRGISQHRPAAARVSRLLWGPERYPDHYALVTWAFLRLLALIYLAAFGSLAVQIIGLVGAEGILPATEYLARVQSAYGSSAFWRVPTLFWLDASDQALQAACWTGMVAAAAVFFGLMLRTSLILCYALYLSLVHAGQTFMEFQWDMLLLESGFLALFLPFGSRIVIWLYRWLVFRFMFMGGIVKLASGDPHWRDLTALRYHLETQPLPSPLAWQAFQLPDAFLQLATGSVLVIEVLVPLLVFLPRNARRLAATAFVVLQSGIMLTGNYNFFNLLTVTLCVFLLEDRDLRPWCGTRLAGRIEHAAQPASTAASASAAVMACVTFSVCAALLWVTNTQRRAIQPLDTLLRVSSTFGIVNGYGPFAVVTTERQEIIVEGSADGLTWRAYEFRYKPGALAKPLSWNIPHQPRLDWQMWFAALGDSRTGQWFPKFLAQLRAGSRPVLALLDYDPFYGERPRYLRTARYRYTFAPPDVKASTARIWQRTAVDGPQPPR